MIPGLPPVLIYIIRYGGVARSAEPVLPSISRARKPTERDRMRKFNDLRREIESWHGFQKRILYTLSLFLSVVCGVAYVEER